MTPSRQSTPAQSLAPAALDNAEVSSRTPQPGSYPPVSSIPSTSPQRLAQAAEASAAPPPATVLYLAYGSNMAASTFLGMRRIRPLSSVNVSVSSLRLTLDLRGVPYWEPCFANVGFREPDEQAAPADKQWDGRLMGVVYEVTPQDWRKIMQTEGAGSSYKEIVVTCVPIRGDSLDGGEPFLARTLYAARSPGGAGACSWLSRMATMTQRPGPAQASARYLKLLADGAREHKLPECYQRYLRSLRPYTITHLRQRIGLYVFLWSWGPLFLTVLKTTGLLADETGKLPPRLAAGMNVLFNVMWTTYDYVLKPVFGDGERTEEAGETGSGAEKSSLLLNGKDG